MGDSNISGPAPETGMPMMCGASTIGTGPKNKGHELLEPPILTTPQMSNPWSPFGGIEAEGARKSTLYFGGFLGSLPNMNSIFLYGNVESKVGFSVLSHLTSLPLPYPQGR